MSNYLSGARARPVPNAADAAALRALESQFLLDGTFTQLVSAITSGTAPHHFAWSSTSVAADDGVNAIKPNDVGGAGRWVAELVHNADVADATLLFAKLAQNSATSGQVIGWNGTAWTPTSVAVSVPASRTLTGAGIVTVAGDHAAHDLTADRTISLDAGGTANRLALTLDGVNVSWGQLVDAQVSPTAAIAVSKLSHGTANQFLVTDATGTVVQWATLSVTGFVPTTRNVNATAPIQVNGGATATLGGDVTISILAATTGALGAVQLANDLAGTGALPVVARINGATVPAAAGSLTTGHLLQVAGPAALTYGFVADANVSPTAAIAVTKLAHGTANQVLTTAGDGVTVTWGTVTTSGLGAVPTSRNLTGAGAIQVAGDNAPHDLSADRTISVLSSTTLALGVVQLAGDLGGTAILPTTLKLRGTSIATAGGALATGLLLVTTGVAAADWQPLTAILPKSAFQSFNVADIPALQLLSTSGFVGGEQCVTRDVIGSEYWFKLGDASPSDIPYVVPAAGATGNWFLQ